jgi:orotate phosphoribosyltransferase
MGAVPVISTTAAIAALHEIELLPFFIRKEPKSHGTQQRIECIDVEQLRDCTVAVVDDVTTTGGSAMLAVDILAEADVNVKHVITIVDREEGAAEAFAAAGIALHPLFRKSEFAADIA